MSKLYNLAKMTTSTTGTGTLTLDSAVSGFLTFAQAGVQDGDIVSYGIVNGSSREVGTGTYTASGTTLTRSVINSTNSNALVSLSGSSIVFITALAKDVPSEIDYVEVTTDKNITATTAATAETFITGNSKTYDGNTRIKIEFWTQMAAPASGSWAVINLWQDSTDLGRIGQIGITSSNGGTIKGEFYTTPSSGSHTYYIKAWTTSGTAVLYAASASSALPSFLRITRA